jgi:hypothetical protein
MTKADFVWTVGYQGNTALVNKTMKSKYRNPVSSVLLEAGFLRAAFCAALWENKERQGALEQFTQHFTSTTGLSLSTEEIMRLLGVFKLPEAAIKVQSI